MRSSQVAPFWQGSDSHSSMLTEQFSPVNESPKLTPDTSVSGVSGWLLTCEAWMTLAEITS